MMNKCKTMMKLMTAMLLSICCLTSYANQLELHAPQEPPSIDIYDLDNKKFDIKKLEGNVVVLHFWATWCASCTESMMQLNKLQRLVRKDPIIIVPVSEDFKGREVIDKFYIENNLDNLIAFVDRNNSMFRAFKVTNLPASFILNPSGQIVAKVSTKIDWLDPGVVESLRKCIAIKATDNQDYVSLLNEQKKQAQSIPASSTTPEIKIPRGGETYAIPKLQKEINNEKQ